MAVHGLRQLLQPELRGEPSISLEPVTSSRGNQQCLDSAILILPLINDYLRHYIEMLDTALDTSSASTTSTSASSSSDSFDISSESPTGSVGLFLKTVAGFANDLESLCIAALHTLHELLASKGIRDVLLHTEPGHTTETHMETEVFTNSLFSGTQLRTKASLLSVIHPYTHVLEREMLLIRATDGIEYP